MKLLTVFLLAIIVAIPAITPSRAGETIDITQYNLTIPSEVDRLVHDVTTLATTECKAEINSFRVNPIYLRQVNKFTSKCIKEATDNAVADMQYIARD